MGKRETIAHLAANEAEAVLLARVYERMQAAQSRCIPAASCFLTPREQQLTAQLLHGFDVRFFGGTEAAERRVCVHLPEYLDEQWLMTADDAPVAAVHAEFFSGDALTHRDILGGLMGCGIKRETVGNIYVQPGQCEFLLTREILPYVLQSFTSAGRTKLHLRPLPLCQLQPPEQKLKTIRDTLASLRLDALIASGFYLARGKAAALVAAGKVELNGALCEKADRSVSEGDTVSVRGLGKLRLDTVGGTTRKDRLSVTILRYL